MSICLEDNLELRYIRILSNLKAFISPPTIFGGLYETNTHMHRHFLINNSRTDLIKEE